MFPWEGCGKKKNCGADKNSGMKCCHGADIPGIGYMYDFAACMIKPELCDYQAKFTVTRPKDDETELTKKSRDLAYVLQNRFLAGYNSKNTAAEVCNLPLQPLAGSHLSKLPVWQGEYKTLVHSTVVSARKDIQNTVAGYMEDLSFMHGYTLDPNNTCRNVRVNIVNPGEMPLCDKPGKMTEDGAGGRPCVPHGTSAFSGYSLFEFQRAYSKGVYPKDDEVFQKEDDGWGDRFKHGPIQGKWVREGETEFGIYEFGKRQNATLDRIFWEQTGNRDFPVWCLRDRRNEQGQSWAEATATILGGSSEVREECPVDDTRVPMPEMRGIDWKPTAE